MTPNPHPTPSAGEMTPEAYLELASKATQGPWRVKDGFNIIAVDPNGFKTFPFSSSGIPHEVRLANYELVAAARNESTRIISGLLEDVETINKSFTDLCDALGCKYDNEEALMAVDSLKAELADLLRVVERLEEDNERLRACEAEVEEIRRARERENYR